MPDVLSGAIERWVEGKALVHRIARWQSVAGVGVHFVTVCNLQGIFERNKGFAKTRETRTTTCLWCASNMENNGGPHNDLP
jgi:hypothetical protein